MARTAERFLSLFVFLISISSAAPQPNDSAEEADPEQVTGKPLFFQGVRGINYDFDALGPYLLCDEYKPECIGSVENCTFKRRCRANGPAEVPFCVHVSNAKISGNMVINCFRMDPQDRSCFKEKCISKPTPTRDASYCCCNVHNCNSNVDTSGAFNETDDPGLLSEIEKAKLNDASGSNHLLFYLIAILAGAVMMVVLLSLVFWKYSKHKGQRQNKALMSGMPPLFVKDDAERPLVMVSDDHLSMSKLELVARGRYGEVYRGCLGDAAVAVKIFPKADVISWQAETDIYAVEGLQKHENILRYIGSEIHDGKYWLITEYHEKGSLYQHLTNGTFTLREALKVMSTMLAGLSFLHEEKTLDHGVKKPCVVHRDFKSRNVLLKPDLNAVIADFGLALKCENGKSPAEGARGQVVGTKRYMSPEVLEGATEFSAFAFRQIDVYAASLVVWEIIKRTSFNEKDRVEEYRQPFEDELGPEPTVCDLRMAVVRDKKRPRIRETIFESKVGCMLWNTVQDMWDAEPDGRITAGCALERINNLYNTVLVDNEHSTASAEEAALSSMYNTRDDAALLNKGIGNEAVLNEMVFHGMYAPPNQHLDSTRGFPENFYSFLKHG